MILLDLVNVLKDNTRITVEILKVNNGTKEQIFEINPEQVVIDEPVGHVKYLPEFTLLLHNEVDTVRSYYSKRTGDPVLEILIIKYI